MSKSKNVACTVIDSLVVEYVNKAGKAGCFVQVATDAKDRWPLKLFPQECLRLIAAYEAAGHNVGRLLAMFKDGQEAQPTAFWGYATHEGNPVILLTVSEDDKRPLMMGVGKATKLLSAIDTHGIESVVATCGYVAGDAQANLTPRFESKAKAAPAKRAKGPAQTPKAATHSPAKAVKMAAAKAALTPKAAPVKSTAKTHPVMPVPTVNQMNVESPLDRAIRLQAEAVQAMRQAMAVQSALAK